jgi:hypothetical protein
LMKWSAYHVDIGHESPQALKNYIARKLQQACRYNDANKAFGFTREKKQRQGRRGSNYIEKQRQCSIGYRVAQLIEEMPSKSKAYELAAEEYGISKSEARFCYETYMKV